MLLVHLGMVVKMKTMRNKGWRAEQKKNKEQPVTPYKKNRNYWGIEKNWKHLYIRSVKLKRAKQLGIEYPIQKLSNKVDENCVDMRRYHTVTSYLEQSHKNGADALCVEYGKDALLLCLADGAGGVSGSKEASSWVMEWFSNHKNSLENALTLELLEEAVLALDQEMYGAKNVGESTLVLALITESQIMGVSVGDSACWMFAKAFEHELSLMQYRKPLLGSGEAKPIGFCMELMGDVLMASDGLFDYVPMEKIKELMHHKDTDATALASLAKESIGGLQDDISVVLVRIGKNSAIYI